MKILESGDHTMIKCSNCDKKLLDILHTDPEAPVELKVKALCPYCGDHSFPQNIQGRFHYSAPMEFVGDTEKLELYIEEVKEEENEILFVVKEIK